jgi:hypothetical protein
MPKSDSFASPAELMHTYAQCGRQQREERRRKRCSAEADEDSNRQQQEADQRAERCRRECAPPPLVAAVSLACDRVRSHPWLRCMRVRACVHLIVAYIARLDIPMQLMLSSQVRESSEYRSCEVREFRFGDRSARHEYIAQAAYIHEFECDRNGALLEECAVQSYERRTHAIVERMQLLDDLMPLATIVDVDALDGVLAVGAQVASTVHDRGVALAELLEELQRKEEHSRERSGEMHANATKRASE